MRSSTGRRGRPVRTKQSDLAAKYPLPENDGHPSFRRSPPPSRSRRSNPSSITGSQQRSSSTSSSSSNVHSESDSGADPSDTCVESESDTEILCDSTSRNGAEDDLEQCGSVTELDTDGEEIMKDIDELEAKGKTKRKHSTKTKELWQREAEHWEVYCSTIKKRTNKSPVEMLLACIPSVFKAYLRWRQKHSRIVEESTMTSYWKRISLYYQDKAGERMDANTLDDICNFISTLGLKKTVKEKLAMFVQDLCPIHHALWVDDKKPRHGYVRVVISLLLILSAATATRPQALLELRFRDVELMKVRTIEDPGRATIVANVNLEKVKNKDRSGRPKKFSFRLESLPCFCIVMVFLALGFFFKAFRYDFADVQEIFDLRVPTERNVLRLKWKADLLDRPIFCDFKSTPAGTCLLEWTAFVYGKYRDIFVWLGLVAGFEQRLELYQLRRASGRNINLACDSVERNQVMGHLGDVYERYYTPTHIARDFQSIYFGTPSQDELILSVARMGLSRDRRAPTELSEAQVDEVWNDPELVRLREERELYRKQLRDNGYYPSATGKGTVPFNNYEATKRKIASTNQKLRKQRLNQVIREFHDSIDTIEITKQMSSHAAANILTPPAIEFELQERAAIANMLFTPIQDDTTRVKFVCTLTKLCRRQETRQPKASKRKDAEWDAYTDGNSSKQVKIGSISDKGLQDSGPLQHVTRPKASKRKNIEWDDGNSSTRTEVGRISAKGLRDSESLPHFTTVEIQSLPDFPIRPPYPLCLICVGNEEFTHKRRLKPWRKDSLKRHIKVHFEEPEYQDEFECRHPACSEKLHGIGHFKRHALDVHQVCH